MSEYQTRPTCNMIPECDKPGIILIGKRICCADHLFTYVKKQEEMQDAVIGEMMRDA